MPDFDQLYSLAALRHPTSELRRAVDEAIREVKNTSQQELLLDRYFDVTCGDCIEGRCHWGGEESRESEAAASEGREYREQCGCDRHAVSVRWRDVPHAAAEVDR